MTGNSSRGGMEFTVKAGFVALTIVLAVASSACIHGSSNDICTAFPMGELIHTKAGSGTPWIEYAC